MTPNPADIFGLTEHETKRIRSSSMAPNRILALRDPHPLNLRGVKTAQRRECRVYWGSHGCMLERGHYGAHRCVCDLDANFDPVTRQDADGVLNVGAPPYYGPDTRFYGEDAGALGLPLVKC